MRKNGWIQCFVMAIAALSAPLAAEADPLLIVGEVQSVVHSFRSTEGGGYESVIGDYYGSAPVPSVQANLANFDAIRFSMAAPSDFQFDYTPRAEIDHASFHVGLSYSYTGGFTRWDVLPTRTWFRALDGSLVEVFSSVETRVYDGGANFYMEGWLPMGGVPLSFVEFIIEADLRGLSSPLNQSVLFVPSFGSAVGLVTYSRGGISDPGPVLSLSRANDVPEPNSAALIALAIAALLGVRLRLKGPVLPPKFLGWATGSRTLR